MIMMHFGKIFDHRLYKNSCVILSVESNYGGAVMADRVSKEIQARFGAVIPRGDKPDDEGAYGIVTTEAKKAIYVHSLSNILEGERMYTANKDAFITMEKPSAVHSSGREAMTSKLSKQLCNFRKEVQHKPGEPFHVSKFTYSGKSRSGIKDDLVMTLMMSLHSCFEMRTSPAFRRWAYDQGIHIE